MKGFEGRRDDFEMEFAGLELEEVGLEGAFWRGVCLYEEFEGSMINILGGSFEGRFEYGGVMEFVLHGGSWKGCWEGLLRGVLNMEV
jgi:hypothetical protein